MPEAPLLDDLRQRVADRDAVDWEACTRDPRVARAFSDEDLRELALLRVLDEIAVVHSQLQSGALPDDERETGAAPPARVVEDDTLDAWGRYRLDEKVGRGGFGSVYRAWDPVLEMPVAIKILHRRYGDRQLTERLLREGRALAQISHPNVVRVLNVEEHDGRLGLVMEFLRGETMDAMVAAQGALNDREAAVIVEDVCRALAVVHAHGLVHRDVKARNIIRERAGRIVLMDFGAGLSQTPTADEAAAVGTPLYSAPETLRGAPATPASDVYSVGVLLYHLVTGRYPYAGRSVEEILAAQGRGGDVAAALLALRPDLPMTFVQVVSRALATDPVKRYGSASALLHDLVGTRRDDVSWARHAVMAVGVVTCAMLFLTLGGMLSSGAFNKTLGRGAFGDESFAEWFRLGRRSLLLPLLLALLGAGGIGMLLALRRVLVAASSVVETFDRRVLDACLRTANRLRLDDPGVSACWLTLLTSVAVVAVWYAYAPLIAAVTTEDVSMATAETLALLSPAREREPTTYRMLLSVIGAGSIAAWYLLMRTVSARGQRLAPWFSVAYVAVLLLLYGSMQLPYKLALDADEFPEIRWQGQKCHVMGQRENRALLFCAGMQPRRRVVDTTRDPLPPFGEPSHLFESFGPASH